ncbi:hypothetical protein CWI42_121080 [Ordospora colligata]|uniref:Uncharacterized protein n=1 Tax=Ordospora colligata OC4 TaxID=1354746 RepID=A0A0B2UCW5_9MICR|nr:uncharacterized protein M896_121080 [Ordospora colligata OC4]KHN68886.1 hypothetical protein M896_121080 [Ordospora colligata OC4]TBU13920.1 hypothetical protein CWI40_121080 [Ordospora colligata]TBU14109.1 hypothetical protein CWI41_121080 [Ordospora colligata]TBU17778.1 hypothetical protein CWI42_121080 [Ordospora colligata]
MFVVASVIIPLLGLTGILATEAEFIPCTDDDKVYDVKLHVHLDGGAIDAIHDVIKHQKKQEQQERREDGQEIEETVPEIEEEKAIEEYLYKGFLQPYNDFAFKYNILFDMDLTNYDANSLLNNKFDRSCEIYDPLEQRNGIAYNKQVEEVMGGNTGVHIWIWSCPSRTRMMSGNFSIASNPNGCGRSVSVMWDGTEKTIDYIMEGLTEAISGEKAIFSNGKAPTSDQTMAFSKTCSYVYGCIPVNDSINGKVNFEPLD